MDFGKLTISCTSLAIVLLAATSAFAQRASDRALIDTGAEDPYAPKTVLPAGMSVTGGGGVIGFLDKDARDFSGVGGEWNARFALGTRFLLAGEVAYVGSGQGIDALGLDKDANLVANGAEVAARLNILPGIVQPYLLAGVGFTHYELMGDDFNTSSVEDADNVAHFPLAIGTALRYRGFIADLRGVIRPVAGDSMFDAGGGSLDTLVAQGTCSASRPGGLTACHRRANPCRGSRAGTPPRCSASLVARTDSPNTN